MSTKPDIRQRFKELETRIDGLVQRICPPVQPIAQEPSFEPVYTPKKSEKIIHLSVPRTSDLVEAVPDIRIPGVAPSSRPLITPIIQSVDTVASDAPAPLSKVDTGISDATNELIAALEAPLVATGQIKAVMLKKVASDDTQSWAQWWVDVGTGQDDAQAMIATRFIGPWFSRSVIGSASRVLIGSGAGTHISDSEFQRVVQPYVVSISHSDISANSTWSCVVALIGVLAGRGHTNAGSLCALTLASRLVECAVSLGQLDPQRVLEMTSHSGQMSLEAKSRWTEYMQIVCTLPERVANRIDPHSIPQALLPRPYFSRLAKATVSYCGSDATADLVVELCAKICRVGQTEVLCAELAAALATSASARLSSSEEEPVDGVSLGISPLARLLTRIPLPLRARVISGTVGQLDLMGSKYFGASPLCSATERMQFNHRLVLIMCVIMHGLLDADTSSAGTIDEAVSSILLRADGATAGGASVRPSSIATIQAFGLSLQLLSGKYRSNAQSDSPLEISGSSQRLLDVLPKRTFPNLLLSAVTRVLIPTWSFSDTVAHARMEDIKPLTALILMCVGALSTEECTKLSMSSEFSRAIPRFLDAPTPLVRLSGIIVADCIVGSVHVAKRNAAVHDPEELDGKIDFGLDDIIRDAQRTTQPVIKASAEYIIETRRYARPIEQQWADAASEEPGDAESQAKSGSMADAIEFMRAYNGIDDSDTVYAPRQSSLTAEAELSSGYIKPRTPVFLRDCLAYLKNHKDDTERAKIGLFALTDSIERANTKAVEELWLQIANKVLYMYNRGSEDLDWAWDIERQKTLVALTVKLPELLGPFLADRSCDRNLTIKDREIVFSAIATACLQLSGHEDVVQNGRQASKQGVADIAKQILGTAEADNAVSKGGGALGAGTVVRRSRRLDLLVKPSAASGGQASSHLQAMQRKYASIVGPALFFPLIAQYGKSDMTSSFSDIRGDASQLERYINTLAVMLYTSGSATHQITMNREFWDLAKLVRRMPSGSHGESPPVLDALLFGIDVILSPERALSTPTLAREFRNDIADTLHWINSLVEQGVLSQSAMAHAARIVSRLQEIQGDVYRRMTSKDFDQYTSIL
ncbi:telomere binding protein [Coemansia aciculifera]|uniref:Telomere binding protein n=1 Tax=Coemansia aciculifera TaxID=417176 RepID=A0A9W8ILW4_9FUNG|nr:telomere binding protein [Coemansia aciculifera]